MKVLQITENLSSHISWFISGLLRVLQQLGKLSKNTGG